MATKRKTNKPSPQPSQPSAEWLAEMTHKEVKSLSEEERGRLRHAWSCDEEGIQLLKAQEILTYYDAAQRALAIRRGETKDPLQHEELFTPEEIDNGLAFGTKKNRGWINVVTGQRDPTRATRELEKWVDGETELQAHLRENPSKLFPIHERPQFYGLSGKEWVAWMREKIHLMPHLMAVRLMRQFNENKLHEKRWWKFQHNNEEVSRREAALLLEAYEKSLKNISENPKKVLGQPQATKTSHKATRKRKPAADKDQAEQ
jgi:hypothetical protein